MVGSSFILTQRNGGRRTLLNINQVVSIYTKDIELATKDGQFEYKQYPLSQGTLYTIQLMLTSQREMEYVFATAAERNEFYDQMVAEVAPSVVIENTSALVPKLPDALIPDFRKPSFPNEVFATEEEYDRAMAYVMRDLTFGKVLPREPMPVPAPTPPAPSEKPPRKPYTRKPKP